MGELPTFRLYKMDELIQNIKKLLDPNIHLMDVQENHQFDSVRIVVDSEEPISIEVISAITCKIRDSEIIDKFFPDGYKMEVTSAGVTTNLIEPFQFRKNISRELKLKLINGDSYEVIKTILKDVDDSGIFIQKDKEIEYVNYENIKQANVVVSFS